MPKKEKFTMERMSEEDLNQFADEVFQGKWIYLNPEQGLEEPWTMLNLDLFIGKHEIINPEKVVPWHEKRHGARGYLAGSMKLVHLDDHNEVVKRLAEARKVVSGVKIK